tara:strand:- start:703 stop:1593 length:891 start_codon:yes stop_codon:yes gene_type:complete
MISFVELGNLGRLGNQFFQYAALRSLGLRHGYETKIPDLSQKTWHGQQCLLAHFNLKANTLTADDVVTLKARYFERDYMTFDSSFYKLPDNIDLYGFFQSTLYFKGFEKEIKEEFTPRLEFIEKAIYTLKKIKEENPGYEIVSLHLRRGDNTDGSNSSLELNEMYGLNNKLDMNSFYGQYLTKAKECFNDKKVKFLVFSGGIREAGNDNSTDTMWCRQNLRGEEYLFAPPNDSMTDFCLIRECDHNIISHISSFGWWAAYLNPNKNKTVVAPLHYHPDKPVFTHRDGFYPTDWRLV